jgi:hypothetical protein
MRELPSAVWLGACARAGFELPECVPFRKGIRERKLAGLDPWAWSPGAWERARAMPEIRERLVPASGGNAGFCGRVLAVEKYPFNEIFSKTWLAGMPGRDPAGRVVRSLAETRAAWAELGPLAAKAPYGAAGTQVQRLESETDLAGARGGWLEGVLRDQGEIWVEPWVAIEAELSIQFEVNADRTEILGIRRFETGPRREYRGADLDASLTNLGPERLAFLHAGPLARLRETAQAAGARLREAGYEGPAGIDAYLWRDAAGQLRFQPLSELNPRYTMGRVALELERRVRPGRPARWRWVFRNSSGG